MSHDENHNFVPDDLSDYKVVREGDLVINKMKAWQGSLGLAPMDGVVSPAYFVFDLKIANRRYGELLLRTKGYVAFFARASDGVRIGQWDLSVAGMKRIPVVIPPLAEQAAIVRFLEHADRRIRRAIRAKQKLIALLNEQKQAVIHRAITRGLDPDARVKPSGVDWLGEIPEHWDVKKLKWLTRFRNGFAFKPEDWGPAGTPIIRIQNLNGSDDFNRTTRTDVPSELRIQPNDLLFAWSGNRGTSFGSFVWDREFDGYLNQHIFKLAHYELNRSYFAHLLRAVTTHVEEQAHGIIGLVHITKPSLGAIYVPVAPSTEQDEIAAHIDAAVAEIDTAIRNEKTGISLLREYRTRLFDDVVTGKLDVRAAATELPEAVDESTPLDEIDVEQAEGSEVDQLEAVEA
jgi:type I restriction enzyme S subunit